MTYNAPESASADATGQVGGEVENHLGEKVSSSNDKTFLASPAGVLSPSDTTPTAPPAAGKTVDNVNRFPAHPDHKARNNIPGFPHLACTAEHEFEAMFLRDGLSPAQASGLAAAIAGLASMMAQEAVASLLGRMMVTRAGTALALAIMPQLETVRDAAARLKMSRSTLADEVARMREVMR